MGGGPVLQDMYVPYNWPVSRFFDLPFYGTTSSPGYYCGFDGQSPLVGLLPTPQDWPSYTAYRNHRHEEANEKIARNDQVRHTEPVPRKDDEIDRTVKMPSVQSEGVTESEFQSEEVGRGGFQSEGVEKDGGVLLEGGDEEEGCVQPEEVEKEGRFQPEVVDEKEGEFQPEQVEESEVGSDEERRAATVVQARYRGHLVRTTRPLVQLRAIAGIEAKLKRLKEQAGSRAFEAELQKEKSMAKVGFEEDTLALLIELDNIQGSHPLVRQIRKSVVREIVDLQKTVDALHTQ